MELFTLVWIYIYQTSADTTKWQQVNFRNAVSQQDCLEMRRHVDGMAGGIQQYGENGFIKVIQSTAICVPISGVR